MGIIKRTPADAMRDAANAEAKATELESQATEAEATAQRMDAESLGALVDDPGQAEAVNAKIGAQERVARAYRMKANEHRDKVPGYHREALELEAAQLDRDAERVDREADKLTEKRDAALKTLHEVDGYEWERKPTGYNTDGTAARWSADGAAGDKRGEAEALRVKARNNRYYIQHGRRAQTIENLDKGPGAFDMSGLTSGLRVDASDYTTDLLAQIASGTVPAEVTA